MKHREDEFKIKFGGQVHQIDAQTFINSLINISTIIQEINQELESGKKIEIKIKATEKGSFITTLSLQETIDTAQRLFTRENITLIANIIEIFAGVLFIKGHLGSKKPKNIEEKGDKIKIENNEGVINIFDNRTYGIYNRNQVIGDAISNNFSTLENDPSIDEFEIIYKEGKSIFKAVKEDFSILATKTEIADENKRARIIVATIITHKIVWENRYKWEFYYGPNKISAYVKDDEFFQKIEKGKSFSKGDALRVDLQINQIFDKSAGIFVNHSYQINKVHEHMLKGKQMKLEDINEPGK